MFLYAERFTLLIVKPTVLLRDNPDMIPDNNINDLNKWKRDLKKNFFMKFQHRIKCLMKPRIKKLNVIHESYLYFFLIIMLQK
jgi:hypothetical protein